MQSIRKYVYLIAFLFVFSIGYTQINAAEINDNKSWTKILKDDWSMEGKYSDCETARIENEKDFGYTRSPCLGSENNQYYYLCTKSNCGDFPSISTETTVGDENAVNSVKTLDTVETIKTDTSPKKIIEFKFHYKDSGKYAKKASNLNIKDNRYSNINIVGIFDNEVKIEDIKYCKKIGDGDEVCTAISELKSIGTKNSGGYTNTGYLSYNGNGIYREEQAFEYIPGKLIIRDLGYFRDIRGKSAKFWLKINQSGGYEEISDKLNFSSSKLDEYCYVNGIDNLVYDGGFSIYTNCSKGNSILGSGSLSRWGINTLGICNRDEIKIIKSAKKLDYCSSNINCIYKNTYYQCKNEYFFNPTVKINIGDGNYGDNDIGINGKDISVVIPKGSNNIEIILKSPYFNDNNTYLCNGNCVKLVNGKNGFSYENGIGWYLRQKIGSTGLKFQVEARNSEGESIIRTKFVQILNQPK